MDSDFSIHAASGVNSGTQSLNNRELTEEEQRIVAEMKKRDREVRAHEQAHLAAAGSLAMGGAKYEYELGPDKKRYAVSGSVTIDTKEVPNNPEATVQKARKIQRAALAPQDPSPQDRKVAAEAKQMELKAQQELQAERSESLRTGYTRSGETELFGSFTATFSVVV